MTNEKRTIIDLHLFDGSGGAGAGGEGSGDGTAGLATGTGEIVYGKQEDAQAESKSLRTTPPKVNDAGSQDEATEDRKAAFENLINGEYKDLFTEKTQGIINRRFKETKELEDKIAAIEPVIDMLMSRYKVSDTDALTKAIEDDDAYWIEAADENGLTVEQYKHLQKLERENAQLLKEQRARETDEKVDAQMQQWIREADILKEKYPNFDLQTEVANPEFLRLLGSNLPVEHAYKLIHYDELMNQAVMTTAQNTEKRVVDNVRAKGTRPIENGTSSQSAFMVKDDVHKLSKKDRAEIARRAARGEMISF